MTFPFLTGCSGVAEDKPYTPQNQTETNVMKMLTTFLDSKIAGAPNDQMTCNEGTAQLPLDIKSYMVTDIKTSEGFATVKVTGASGEKKNYRFQLLAADVQNGAYCILGFKPGA
ncbi:MAG: hypothetical protein K1Y36_17490 [Blastocatellia bacterium]|nr:hypothetical protein [Blastocatellia bacterium]